jgi:hypothetical protein
MQLRHHTLYKPERFREEIVCNLRELGIAVDDEVIENEDAFWHLVDNTLVPEVLLQAIQAWNLKIIGDSVHTILDAASRYMAGRMSGGYYRQVVSMTMEELGFEPNDG